MFQLREPYTPPIFVVRRRQKDALVRVGGVSLVGAGPLTTETLLYAGVPAVVAGGAAFLLGMSIPIVLVAAVAAGGLGYGVQKMAEKSPGAATPPGTTPPGEAAPGKAAEPSKVDLKEMAYPGSPAGGVEAYATETPEEKRARELGENWGYTYAIWELCNYPSTPSTPPLKPTDTRPPPSKVKWKLAPDPSASATSVLRNFKNLAETYDAAFEDAWRFGASETEKPDFDCSEIKGELVL